MKKLFLILALFATSVHAQVQVPKNMQSSIWVYNTTQNRVEYDQNSRTVRPIASVTKLMTALVALDHDTNLTRILSLSNRVDTHLPRQRYNRGQLLQAMLVKSDNAAAETLAHDYPGGRAAFIARMNAQAQEWGMTHTKFEDPTGLGANNISSAAELATLLKMSANNWLLQHTTTRKQVALESHIKNRVQTVSLNNTNSLLLNQFDNIVVGKTGLTSRAGWCVGIVANQNADQYVIIVLGATSKHARFQTVEKLMHTHVNAYELAETKLTLAQ
jgi:D-alanyl-D-alanine endopeptidase (penicillin-binding protein 7)